MVVLGDFQGVFSDKLKKRLSKENFDLIIGVGDYGGIDDWRPWLAANFKSTTSKNAKWITPKEFFGVAKLRKLVKKDREAGKKVLKEINKLGKPAIIVFGNTDDEWYSHPEYTMKAKKMLRNYLAKLKNVKEITYSNKLFKGVQFIGFGGYMDIEAYFNKKNLTYQDDEIVKRRLKKHLGMRNRFFKLINKAKSGREKLFIFHYPPIGKFDIIRAGWKGNPMIGKSSGVRFYNEAIEKYKPRIAFCGHMHEYQGVKRMGKTLIVNPGDAAVGKYAIVDLPDSKMGKIKLRFVK